MGIRVAESRPRRTRRRARGMAASRRTQRTALVKAGAYSPHGGHRAVDAALEGIAPSMRAGGHCAVNAVVSPKTHHGSDSALPSKDGGHRAVGAVVGACQRPATEAPSGAGIRCGAIVSST